MPNLFFLGSFREWKDKMVGTLRLQQKAAAYFADVSNEGDIGLAFTNGIDYITEVNFTIDFFLHITIRLRQHSLAEN